MRDEFSELFASTASATIVPSQRAAGDAEPIAQGKPAYEVKTERPEHRAILELIAKGFTFKEVAEMTGRSATTVQYISKQPATQQVLANTVKRNFGEDEKVVEVIRTNVLAAVEMLATVVKDPNQRAADRIAAADRLLERRYGKANQPINRGTDVDLNSLSDSDLARMLPTEGTGTT